MYSPKRLDRALGAVLLGDERRSREGDPGSVRKGLEDVVAQVRALGAMRLVDHQNDALGRVDYAKSLT